MPAQAPSSWAMHTLLTSWVWHCQGSLAWPPAVHCSQHQLQDKQFLLEPRNPRKSPLLNATRSLHSPGQILCKYNEHVQLREGDVPKKLNTADPWGPGNRSFTGLEVGHCTLLLLKSNERSSVLTSVNTGDSYWHILRWQNWDRSVYCHPQIHSPPTSQKLTNKGTPSALGQTWTRAGQTLYDAWRTASLSSWYSPCPSCATNLMWK